MGREMRVMSKPSNMPKENEARCATDTASHPVTVLPGVGPVRAKAYLRLGIETCDDLVYHFPRGYENRGDVKLLSETPDAAKTPERAAVMLTVATEPKMTMIRRGMTLLRFRAYDESGTAEITYFNQNYLRDAFELGREYRFYGKIVHPQTARGKYTLSSPAYEPIPEDGAELPPFYPVYPLSEGLSMGTVQRDIGNALERVLPTLADPLPEELRQKNRLCTLSYAIRNIQRPTDFHSLAAAKRRLVFDEFFSFSLAMAMGSTKRVRTGAPALTAAPLERLYQLLPYRLTGAQERSIDEIRSDMAKETPMNRILVGDVGSGKTIVSAAAILIALASGKQAAMMAPTEILARQHYAELSGYFEALGFRVALLTGATTAAEKRRIYAGLAAESSLDRIDLVVGTHALLSDGVEFVAPGLVVTDEQHRFGVEQRATLARKSKNAHLLVMSATPIPRSLALVLYGDLDVSRIDEMPPGRQKVETFAVDERYRERLNRFIEKQVSLGGLIYVVCPSIEERASEEDTEGSDLTLSSVSERCDGWETHERDYPLKSAVTYAKTLQAALPDIPVALMHGKMKPKEKDAVMAAFISGETKVLVSTTVIEVGVNVPAATLMIIENADRFGLSQLHQLRGRVGRGKAQSYCVLVSEASRASAEGCEPSAAYERLRTLCENHDGFLIAEKDLALRGPGDFFGQMVEGNGGIRQSGGLRFRLADLATDSTLLTAAAEGAKAILSEDPMLESHPALKSLVSRYRVREAETIN